MTLDTRIYFDNLPMNSKKEKLQENFITEWFKPVLGC